MSAPPTIDFADPDFCRDPFETYAWLREHQPVYEHPLGFRVLSRYEDCLAALKDADTWSSDTRNATLRHQDSEYSEFLGADVELQPDLFFDPPRYVDSRPFLFLDAPMHTRMRGLFSRAFTRHALDSYRAHIEQLAGQLMDEMRSKHEVDLVESFAYPLPVSMICHLMGVPAEDHELFRDWSRTLIGVLKPDFLTNKPEREQARKDFVALAGYFGSLMEERRGRPTDDLLSGLLETQNHPDSLDPVEIIGCCMQLLVAGHETTTNLIANAALALLRDRDQLKLLIEDPEVTRSAVEEFARYDSPLQVAARVPMRDVELHGEVVPAGQQTILLLGSANRDAAVFEQPDRLDLRRSNAHRNIGFGSGPHVCIGGQLARLEGEVALRVLVRYLNEVELVDEPVYRADGILRGVEHLRVRAGRTEQPDPASAFIS